jgi:P-type conjugative transfer protein TrbJ
MRRPMILYIATVLTLSIAQPAQAWFGWSLPYFVFDASRFAEQVRAVQAELQWIESMRSQLGNDVLMLRSIEYSNSRAVTTGLQRLESAAARVDKLAVEPQRLGELIARDWPTAWSGQSNEAGRFDAARQAWVASERHTLADVRAVQSTVITEMQSTRDRVSQLVATSNGFSGLDSDSGPGLTLALQARTQLHAELSSELAKLQVLRATRAAMRSERAAREQSEQARARAVADWLNRTDGVQPPPEGQRIYPITPITEMDISVQLGGRP